MPKTLSQNCRKWKFKKWHQSKPTHKDLHKQCRHTRNYRGPAVDPTKNRYTATVRWRRKRNPICKKISKSNWPEVKDQKNGVTAVCPLAHSITHPPRHVHLGAEAPHRGPRGGWPREVGQTGRINKTLRWSIRNEQAERTRTRTSAHPHKNQTQTKIQTHIQVKKIEHHRHKHRHTYKLRNWNTTRAHHAHMHEIRAPAR